MFVSFAFADCLPQMEHGIHIPLSLAIRGYNKTPEGKWVCANGYNGTARNRCELGDARRFSAVCVCVSMLAPFFKSYTFFAQLVDSEYDTLPS